MSAQKKFADGGKAPEKTTFDWNESRRRNAERLAAEVASGVDDPMTQRYRRDREQMALAQLDRPYLTAQESDRFFGRVKSPSTPKPKPDVMRPKSEGRIDSPNAEQVAEMVRLYTQEHMMPKTIAEGMPFDAKTVIRYLKLNRVYDRTKFRRGPQQTAAARQARWSKTVQVKKEYL